MIKAERKECKRPKRGTCPFSAKSNNLGLSDLPWKMAVLEMACPRPPSCLPLSGCRLHLPRLPGCCKLAVCCFYCRPGIGGSSNLCFSEPGNLGMDRLGAILLERETSGGWACLYHEGALSGGTARNEMPASQMKTRSGSYQGV